MVSLRERERERERERDDIICAGKVTTPGAVILSGYLV
jgi:hypothetical protein